LTLAGYPASGALMTPKAETMSGPDAISEAECAVLRLVPGLASVPESGLKMIAAHCAHIGFAPGEVMVRQGMIDHDCYILLSGAAEVSVQVDIGRVVVARLTPGALVGEIALLCETPRSATVTAADAVTALVVSRDLLPELVSEAPGFAMVMMRALAERLERNLDAIAYFKAAAQALQKGSLDLGVIDQITERDDEVGAFARTFADMAKAVKDREENLKREVQALHIEIDQARKALQVAEITDAPEFQTLLSRAQAMRARRPR
jgi:CRP/FNR family cyclic AMP-dependent transcriptional regulator